MCCLSVSDSTELEEAAQSSHCGIVLRAENDQQLSKRCPECHGHSQQPCAPARRRHMQNDANTTASWDFKAKQYNNCGLAALFLSKRKLETASLANKPL